MNLADLDVERRARLLSGGKPLALARNAMAYVPGDRPDCVYFVRSGRIKIVRSNAAGAEVIVGIRTAGDIFGELAWLPNSGEEQRKTSAVAIEPSTVDGIGADDFAAVLRADAQIALAFARGVNAAAGRDRARTNGIDRKKCPRAPGRRPRAPCIEPRRRRARRSAAHRDESHP